MGDRPTRARVDDVARVAVAATLAALRATARRLAGRPLRPGWSPRVDIVFAGFRGALSVLSAIGGARFRFVGEAMRFLGAGGLERRSSRSPVDGIWLEPPDADGPVVLYLHGGGYMFGSPRGHASIVAAIARAARARAFVVDYRLAPEHPMPAALEDALAAYRGLVAAGTPADRIVLAGDSSGGHLVLTALLALRDAGEPLPAAGVGLSPCVDYGCSGESMRTNAACDLLAEAHCRMVVPAAMGGDARAYAPLFADLAGLPPLLLQVGDAEILRDQVRAFAARAEEAGVDARLSVYPDMVHVWHGLRGLLPEADRASAEIGAFVREHATRGAATSVE